MGREVPGIRTVLGLGNPGFRYRRTRHNLGHRVIDGLCEQWGLRLRRKPEARVGERGREERRILLAKSRGFMNESGRAAGFLREAYGFRPAEFLVILDDVALPLGCLRLRRCGGDGGHKGLRSVLEILGSQEVPRLRLGVGRESLPEDLSDFLLERFDPEEEPAVATLIATAVDCVKMVLEDGLTETMNEFNRKGSGPSSRV